MPKPRTRASHTVREHFVGRAPVVARIYAKLLAAAKKLGPVREDPKKTSIHLVRGAAFAGIATRKESLLLTLRAKAGITSPRVVRNDRLSASRCYVQVRLTSPADVDRELVAWLAASFELSG